LNFQVYALRDIKMVALLRSKDELSFKILLTEQFLH